MLSLFCFVLGLASDLAQYTLAAALWGVFGWKKERWIDENNADKDREEFKAPDWINWPALFFFWLKIIVVLSGHVFLAIYVARTWGVLRN